MAQLDSVAEWQLAGQTENIDSNLNWTKLNWSGVDSSDNYNANVQNSTGTGEIT